MATLILRDLFASAKGRIAVAILATVALLTLVGLTAPANAGTTPLTPTQICGDAAATPSDSSITRQRTDTYWYDEKPYQTTRLTEYSNGVVVVDTTNAPEEDGEDASTSRGVFTPSSEEWWYDEPGDFVVATMLDNGVCQLEAYQIYSSRLYDFGPPPPPRYYSETTTTWYHPDGTSVTIVGRYGDILAISTTLADGTEVVLLERPPEPETEDAESPCPGSDDPSADGPPPCPPIPADIF